MSKKNGLNIGWKVATLTPSVASVRYRAMLPLLACEDKDVNCKVYSCSQFVNLEELDVLIIVKSFSVDDLMLIKQASDRGIPVILDLCDNIFIKSYGQSFASLRVLPATIFKEMVQLAQAIVVTTDVLAEVVRREVGDKIQIQVIPDGVENKLLHAEIKSRLLLTAEREKMALIDKAKKYVEKIIFLVRSIRSVDGPTLLKAVIVKIKKTLYWKKWVKYAYRTFNCLRTYLREKRKKVKPVADNNPNTNKQALKRILWFGSHGAAYANFGMLDLLDIRESLEKVAEEMPVELIIVSNNVEKYNSHIKPFAIPSRYIEWRFDTINKIIREADVVIIPNSLDDFSICKSANRAVLSLLHDTPVVATATPQLVEMESCIFLNDFEQGVKEYLNNPELVAGHIRISKELIEKKFGQNVIADKWMSLLGDVVSNYAVKDVDQVSELIVAMHLPQDIDLALPILEAMSQLNIDFVIWSSEIAVNRWPQLLDVVRQFDFPYRILPENVDCFNTSIFPKKARSLLCISESSLNPHAFTHQLTKLANRAGLFTATVQHGFENIGLTYSDGEHSIGRINFASQKIYTWGDSKTYHSKIPAKTKLKCFPIGCPKPGVVPQAEIMQSVLNGSPVIGIFENLHWHRYSDDYREFFIDSISRVAEAFPDVNFIIKPHNAGMWLTSRYQREHPVAENMIIIDPLNPDWRNVTAPQMLGAFAAVITTPSTVAIDALRQNIPVAMVKHELSLSNYDSLPMLVHFDDWCKFVNKVLDKKSRKYLQVNGQLFLDNIILPGNAAKRIVEDLIIGAEISVVSHV